MHRKLYRAPKDGIIGGIGAGFARYFDTDPVFTRLAIAALALLTKVWPVVLLYGVLYLIMPVDPAQAKVETKQEPKDVTEKVEKMDSGQNM